MKRRFIAKLAVVALISGLMPLSLAAQAVPTLYGEGWTTYAEDTTVTVAGIPLRILAGSVQSELLLDVGSLTVTVPENEAFIIRSPGSPPASLENDGYEPACHVIKTLDNQLLFRGPKTVTIAPSTIYRCSTANYDKDTTPFFNLPHPEPGETLVSGQGYQIFWQTEGQGIDVVRIRLSTDNGQTFSNLVVEGLANYGYYQWAVPTVYTTDTARLKFEGLDGMGNIKALGVTAAFRIQGETPPPPPPPPASAAWNFDPAAVTAAAGSIDANQDWHLAPGATAPDCAGLRIKTADSTAVYYCGQDGKRHAFPNQRIHASWYGEDGNWGGVVTVEAAYLASLPLGGNVTYRPGVRMVKITTDPKTYAVAADGTLRWVPTEAAAIALYGANWNQQIDDLPDAFFTDYTIGEAVEFK